MESNGLINEAFYGVITSSKEIINHRQTNLYCNMLELLRQTCKTVGTNAEKMDKEELAKFWLEDILPLVFEEEERVQKNTLDAFQQFLSTFDAEVWHSCKIWPEVKKNITDIFAAKVGDLRNNQNRFWHRIWCLLVGLLNRELLKSASVINSFLAIVEKGFRSAAPKVRAESFSCWNYLIHIFHKYGELKSPKRIKLVCIPLRTTSSKNLQPKTAAVKMHVWWFLLTCLGKDMTEFIPNAVEPFFTFCIDAIEHFFTTIDLPLICLTTLVSESMEQEVLEEHNLEILCMPSPLLETNILLKHADLLISTMLKALQHVIENQILDVKLKEILPQKLIIFLITAMFASRTHLKDTCSKLFTLLEKNKVMYEFALNNLASRPKILNIENQCSEDEVLQVITPLCVAAKDFASVEVISNFVKVIFKLDNLTIKKNDWKVTSSVAVAAMQLLSIEEKQNIDIEIKIWQNLSTDIIEFLKCQKVSSPKELYTWILWPFEARKSTENHAHAFINESFETTWLSLINAASGSNGYHKFLNSVGKFLTDALLLSYENVHLINIFKSYATTVLETLADKTIFKRNLLTNLNSIISMDNICQEIVDMSLSVSCAIISNLKHYEINIVFEDMKSMITSIIKNLKKVECNKESVEQWKGIVLEKLRLNPDKQKFTQIKDLLKDAPFVIIPTVWSLNPDKLTERQKERICEKSDISALYDNMSFSEKSQLKAWSPKKVVLVRTNEAEIVLCENSSEECKEVEISDAQPTHIVETPCLDLSILENIVENNSIPRMLKHSEEKPLAIKMVQNDNEIDMIEKENIHANDKNNISPDIINSGSSLELEPNQQHQAFNKDMQLSASAEIIKPTLDLSAELINKNECSPKKLLANFVLTSPPNRKSTNNSRSPTLRPKSTGHMTGRGAQLINMIRNKSIDSTAFPTSPQRPLILPVKDNKLEFTSPKKSLTMTLRDQSAPSTPTQDLLTFSKRLPSATASPSVSILKRRATQRDIDEIDLLDTPASKRKRVSFHDPPVSLTKEYVREDGEIKTKSKRCLVMEKTLNFSNDPKMITRRRSSCTEVDRLQTNGADRRATSNIFIPPKRLAFNVGEPTSITTRTLAALGLARETTNPLAMSPLSALNLAVEQLPLNVILEKCLSSKPLTQNCANTFAKVVSQHITTDANIKTTVLEKLSEDHPQETLDCALRENLTSVVCERLPFNSVVEHISKKIKSDEVCRNNMLMQLKDMLKQSEVFNIFECIKCIMEDCSLTDSQIVDLMSTLVQKRNE